MLNQYHIVQSLEDFSFLYPDSNGDVGYSSRIDQAGYFETREEAIEAAEVFIGNAYIVFSFYK